MGEPLSQQHLRHGVEERHVGARALPDPEVGLVAELDALGVHHDEPGAAAHRAPEPHGDHGMVR